MSKGETLIKVEGVSKKFCRKLSRSMYYGAIDSTRNMLGIPYHTDKLRKDEFWALKDINFELKRGEVLGLIGKNGSGKSTLLRLLTGIYPPDKGQITMKGRIGALIAVGAGFHQHMTGRENIYLNGVILGMTKAELKKRIDQIIEFSEIGDFINAPVATYSSGMKVRLGFSIAAHTNPDILLIDEVLAVGDMGFKKKCLNKIQELMYNCAVVFVSHTMPLVARTVNQICLLNKGKKLYYGKDIDKAIIEYYRFFDNNQPVVFGQDNIIVKSIAIKDINKKELVKEALYHGQNYFIDIEVLFLKPVKMCMVHLVFVDSDLNRFGIISSQKKYFSISGGKDTIIKTRLKFTNYLSPNKYAFDLHFSELNSEFQAIKRLTSIQNIIEFQVVAENSEVTYGGIPVNFDSTWEVVK